MKVGDIPFFVKQTMKQIMQGIDETRDQYGIDAGYPEWIQFEIELDEGLKARLIVDLPHDTEEEPPATATAP